MKKYTPQDIEPKWQKIWDDTKLYSAAGPEDKTASDKPKYYYLVEFPYPSGDGLHVGHVLSYTALDIMARHKRMQGFNVLYPMGFDEFGLPTENYAIKHKIAPQAATAKNVATFERQLRSLGLSFDWDRKVNTSDPAYYKWTQWIFLQLLKKGLAYQAEIAINWCPFEKTGLANEEVVGGVHERCGTPVEKKLLKQWVLRITAYADRLIDDLGTVDYSERIASQQINWVGRSEGAEITWKLRGITGAQSRFKRAILMHGKDATPASHWYPMFGKAVADAGLSFSAPEMPADETPRLADWTSQLEAAQPDEHTVLVGHSRGGMAILRWLEQAPAGTKVGRVVLVATNSGEHSDRSGGDFFGKDYDFTKIKQHCAEFVVIHSHDDEWIPFAAAEHIAAGLGVQVTAFDGRRHFGKSAPEFPEIFSLAVAAQANDKHTVTVYTTRPDTLFGATFLVVSPELAQSWQKVGWKAAPEVAGYIKTALGKSDLARQEDRTKTGVDTGITAVHPITGQEIPVWVADYVLGGYGTGAIMAVPAHDQRDYEFAKTFGLLITSVIEPVTGTPHPKEHKKDAIVAILHDSRTGRTLMLDWGPRRENWGGMLFVGGGVEPGETDLIEVAKREIAEETGYTDITFVRQTDVPVTNHYYSNVKDRHDQARMHGFFFELASDKQDAQNLDEGEHDKFTPRWVDDAQVLSTLGTSGDIGHELIYRMLARDEAIVADGVLINSGDFNGLTVTEGKRAIIERLYKSGSGRHTTKYKLRDWIFSRQHYWGEPMPVVHCQACKTKLETAARTIHFYNQNTWDALLTGRKTTETRALNPNEKDRYFGDIKAGDTLKAVNKVTGAVAYFTVSKQHIYKSWDELLAQPEVLQRVYGGLSPVPTTPQQLRQDYEFRPGYAAEIEQNGLVAWDIEPVIPGVVSVPEDQLPVTLPEVASYEPTDTGESPLAAMTDWVNTTCPTCGGPAQRETDTMPNWAGSSWYYLRYADAQNDKEFASPEALKYWTPIDLYNGGMEHTTLHLLYSRFWHKFLYDQGLVPTPEPYARRRSHGMILGPDGVKMSKSRGNVINPDKVVSEYGADTIRLYEMFMGPFEDEKTWSEDHLAGVSRFIYRVWHWTQEMSADSYTLSGSEGYENSLGIFATEVDRATHKTLKKVHHDIDGMHFNTAVSALMEYVNFLTAPRTKQRLLQQNALDLRVRTLRHLVLMLAPFTPHMAEELWHELGEKGSVHTAAWPAYDPALIKDDVVTVIVQVNGKVRSQLVLPVDVSEDELVAAAEDDPKVKQHLAGKTIAKTIVVPRRLVNFVIK